MNKLGVLKSFIFACAIVSALVAANDARADTKAYGGDFCHPFTPSSTASWGRTQGSLQWFSTGTTGTAVCAIGRDNTSNTTGLAAFSATVFDDNVSADLSCTVYLIDTSTNAQTTLDFETRSTAGSTGVQTLNWTSTLATSNATAVYTMACFMPYRTQVRRYVAEEVGPTD